MELLLWLAEVEIWRLQREHASPKEDLGESPDTELSVASYPEEIKI